MAIDASSIRIGTARWNIPFQVAARADPDRKREGSLVRYARHLRASEVNSCFYRHHRPSTWARWAQSTPDDFRFSMKLPKAITHDARLDVALSRPVLEQFLEEVGHLGHKRGPLLVQLPPSLAFDPATVDVFLTDLRASWSGLVACEPRHATWFDAPAQRLLERHEVARVAADPAILPAAAEPGGWPGLVYVRLHGSPRTYYSSYDDEYLAALAERLREYAAGPASAVWCIFDNTAVGAGLPNALDLSVLLDQGAPEDRAAIAEPRFRIISDSLDRSR